MNKWKSYASVILLLSVAISVIVNPMMPDKMASHWNLKGQIDGYMTRFWALSLAPLLILIFILIFSILPNIDPLIKNLQAKREMILCFDKFIFLFTMFIFYIHILCITVNLDTVYDWGLNLNIGQWIMPSLGMLFFIMGIFLMKVRKNWFAGFRTPWAIASDEIWVKTHRIGGWLFVVTGAMVAFSFLWVDIAVWILIAAVSVDVLVPVFYSLYLYLQAQQTEVQ